MEKPESTQELKNEKSEEIHVLADEVIKMQEEIEHLKAEKVKIENEIYSKRTPDLEKEMIKIGDQIMSLAAEKVKKIEVLENLYKEDSLSSEEESLESMEKQFWGETAPELMTYERAEAWVMEISKRDGIEYKIPTIEELEQAHVDQVKGFEHGRIYLSSSVDEFLTGNHLGFDFESGKRESRGKGFYFALRVSK